MVNAGMGRAARWNFDTSSPNHGWQSVHKECYQSVTKVPGQLLCSMVGTISIVHKECYQSVTKVPGQLLCSMVGTISIVLCHSGRKGFLFFVFSQGKR